jgi:hypothetical protein
MKNIVINDLAKIIIICFFPLFILLIQIISPLISIIIGFVFIIGAIGLPTFRKIFLIFYIMVFGYLIWKYIAENISGIIDLSPDSNKIITRFGLLGYIFLFALWQKIQKTENTFFKVGNGKEIIRIPFIWKGFKEIEWRFTLIFCLLWFCVAIIFSIKNGLEYNILYLWNIIFNCKCYIGRIYMAWFCFG